MAKKKKNKNLEPLAEQDAFESPEETTEAEACVEESDEKPVSAEESPEEALQRELDGVRAEMAKNWDLYLRERAEQENYRKRSQRDKEDAIRFANDRLLKEMIPVLDNLERAVGHAGENNTGQQALLEGVDMTIGMFRKVLEEFGVKPIAAAGEAFDPNVHQAMGQVETAEQPPNTVVNEFQKGYMLNDRLLRPALVMVASVPTATPAAEEEEPTDNEQKDA